MGQRPVGKLVLACLAWQSITGFIASGSAWIREQKVLASRERLASGGRAERRPCPSLDSTRVEKSTCTTFAFLQFTENLHLTCSQRIKSIGKVSMEFPSFMGVAATLEAAEAGPTARIPRFLCVEGKS